MKTDNQWLIDTIALFRRNEWGNFCHIMAGWPELTEEEILSHYGVGDTITDDDGNELCDICDSGNGEVCRNAFECDSIDVADELYRPEKGERITLLQVMQFMDVAGLNSNVESISMITDIIEALLNEWKEQAK